MRTVRTRCPSSPTASLRSHEHEHEHERIRGRGARTGGAELGAAPAHAGLAGKHPVGNQRLAMGSWCGPGTYLSHLIFDLRAHECHVRPCGERVSTGRTCGTRHTTSSRRAGGRAARRRRSCASWVRTLAGQARLRCWMEARNEDDGAPPVYIYNVWICRFQKALSREEAASVINIVKSPRCLPLGRTYGGIRRTPDCVRDTQLCSVRLGLLRQDPGLCSIDDLC